MNKIAAIAVEKLYCPEHCGDWHDKPLKWKASNGIKTQKFVLKREAIIFASLWRRFGFEGAMTRWLSAS